MKDKVTLLPETWYSNELLSAWCWRIHQMFVFIVPTAKGEQRGVVTSTAVIVYCTARTVMLCVCLYAWLSIC